MKSFQFLNYFLLNFILTVSSAPMQTKCKIPTNLIVHYNRLSGASIGNKFFLPAEMAPAGSNQRPQTDGDRTFPTSLVSINIVRERSTCPWYLKIIHDPSVFPPSRTEAICRCRYCLDSDENHQCVTVYSKTTVLKRTGECVDGLYAYRPSVIQIATACVCAKKVDIISGKK
ncbi:interleukin 17-like protein [Octopus bimaculoides]|uniref:Interleukin 17-like protein n=1 Tax=Octopus bimaculoides TaxID=37653 RepID=A0A0L8HU75_OCTBM|nr:interleukin 17-like protein [Octopus bimaculoides]|eukprot:XP_014769339.1 PREDICTED: interleukin 17-like protein [Octopus bimaculoides]